MQSSFNVIKNNYVVAQGNKEIITNVDNIGYKDNVSQNSGEAGGKWEEARERADSIIEDANKQRDEIIRLAKERAQNIEGEAYENGYEAGSLKGYSDAYENTLEKAKAEAEEIIARARELLLEAKAEYENYLEAKKEEIILLSINMAETVLKRELGSSEGLSDIIYDVLRNSRNIQSIIIRSNKLHCEEIKTHLQEWKESLVLKGEIFVVGDDNLGPYDCVIEKDNGRVEIGLKSGIDGIKQALL